MNTKHSVILIPSIHPDVRLIDYMRELMQEGFCDIIVVNDGSGEEYEQVFTRLADMGCAVLKHAVNYGKGRALKTGFNEFLNRFGKAKDECGIITVDSDGQHLVKDVVRMDRRLSEAGGPGKCFLYTNKILNFDIGYADMVLHRIRFKPLHFGVLGKNIPKMTGLIY